MPTRQSDCSKGSGGPSATISLKKQTSKVVIEEASESEQVIAEATEMVVPNKGKRKAAQAEQTDPTTIKTKRARLDTDDGHRRDDANGAQDSDDSREALQRDLLDLQAENKSLQTALDATTKALQDIKRLRHTEAESALNACKVLAEKKHANMNRICDDYKGEIDRLNDLLRIPEGERDIRGEIDAKSAEISALQESLRTEQSNVQAIARQLAEVRQEHEGKVKQLQDELKFEIGQSKSLTEKLRATKTTSNISSTSAQNTNGLMAVATPDSTYKERLDIAADLTGLLIHSVHDQADGRAFDCILTDVKGRDRHLAFKLVFHKDGENVSYLPNVDAQRDVGLVACLDPVFLDMMRFQKSQAGKFFRKAWLNVCK